MSKYTDYLYEKAIRDNESEKIYWWEAIMNCYYKNIDNVLEARRASQNQAKQ